MTKVAIDGYSGSGKTTLGKLLAGKLNYLFFDTGWMYREVVVNLFESGLLKDGELVESELVANLTLLTEIRCKKEFELQNRVDCLVSSRYSRRQLYNAKIDSSVSEVAAIKEVREVLVKMQQGLIANEPDIVVIGRDIGLAVMPNADVKFFVEAKMSERVIWRYKQYKLESSEVIEENLTKRDLIDSTRPFSPMQKCLDSVQIVNLEGKQTEIVDKMMRVILQRAGS